MTTIYNCIICKKEYKTYMGFWKHNKKYHNEDDIKNIQEDCKCKHCNSIFSSRQGRWRHEKHCKQINTPTIGDEIQELKNKIKILEDKTPNSITTNNSNNNNKTINNIQYVINPPTASSLDHLTFEVQKEVLDKGLNSLVCLIELLNFNKSVPENHSYCITAINDKHASVIDEKTNKVIKTNKFDLFDKVLGANLENLEKLADNPKFTSGQKQEYKDKINYLKTSMFQNNKFIKRYQNDINIISYNNKDMIKETWKSLKEVEHCSGQEFELNPDQEYKVLGFDDLIDELPEDEKPDFLKTQSKTKTTNKSQPKIRPKSKPLIVVESSDVESDSETEDCEYAEIKIKGEMYILEGNNVYSKNKKGTKAKLYGTYSNGKVKKISNRDFDL